MIAYQIQPNIHTQHHIKVLIVDDHPMTRVGLSLFLNTYSDLELVGEAADAREALEVCARDLPDVVLMDLELPESDGISAMKDIRRLYPDVKVLILTSYQEPDLVERAVHGGASGYLLKNVSAYDLAGAIRAASQGRPITTREAPELLKPVASSHEEPGFDLTERETEVLALMVEGLSNAEIAERLNVSYATVKFHVGGILSKLGVPSRAKAVTLAWQHQLLA